MLICLLPLKKLSSQEVKDHLWLNSQHIVFFLMVLLVQISFGTTTIGLAHGETLLTITPAFSKISNSFCTHSACFKEGYKVSV